MEITREIVVYKQVGYIHKDSLHSIYYSANIYSSLCNCSFQIVNLSTEMGIVRMELTSVEDRSQHRLDKLVANLNKSLNELENVITGKDTQSELGHGFNSTLEKVANRVENVTKTHIQEQLTEQVEHLKRQFLNNEIPPTSAPIREKILSVEQIPLQEKSQKEFKKKSEEILLNDGSKATSNKSFLKDMNQLKQITTTVPTVSLSNNAKVIEVKNIPNEMKHSQTEEKKKEAIAKLTSKQQQQQGDNI